MKAFIRIIFLLLTIGVSVFAQGDDESLDASKIKERFRKAYGQTTESALADDGESKSDAAQFWAKAAETVFGNRAPQGDSAEAKTQAELFLQTNQLIRVINASDKKEYYLGDDEQQTSRLASALDALKAKPSKENYELVAKALVPFLNTIEAKESGPGGLIIPANSAILYKTKPFCLQHNIGAPGSAEPMWLIPSDDLIPPGAREIYAALLKLSSDKPASQGVIQSLIWAIRESSVAPLRECSSSQIEALNAALPDGAAKFKEFMDACVLGVTSQGGDEETRLSNVEKAIGLGLLKISQAKRKLLEENLKKAGIDHGGNPSDPRQTDDILRRLTRPPTSGQPSGGGNPADKYSTVPGQPKLIAVTETTHLQSTEIILINTGSEACVFKPESVVGISRAIKQPVGLTRCGTPSITDAAYEKAIRTRDHAMEAILRLADPNYAPKNPIDGTFLHDRSGQILRIPLGSFKASRRFTDTNDRLIRSIEATLSEYYLITQTGDKIRALELVPGGNPRFRTDCHGFTLTDSRYWVDNADMQTYMSTVGRGFTEVGEASARAGDLVIYRDQATGALVHSAQYLGGGRVRMAAGVVTYMPSQAGVATPFDDPRYDSFDKITEVAVRDGFPNSAFKFYRIP